MSISSFFLIFFIFIKIRADGATSDEQLSEFLWLLTCTDIARSYTNYKQLYMIIFMKKKFNESYWLFFFNIICRRHSYWLWKLVQLDWCSSQSRYGNLWFLTVILVKLVCDFVIINKFMKEYFAFCRFNKLEWINEYLWSKIILFHNQSIVSGKMRTNLRVFELLWYS